MNKPLLISGCLWLTVSGGLGAQQVTDLPAPAPPALSPFHLFSALQAGRGSPAGPGWANRVLTGVGGALVGMGVGYFLSEVAHSDWSEAEGGRGANRPAWAAVGGSLGLALGFSFPITGSAASSPGVRGGRAGRAVITAEEIQEISATDAYEAVRLLRPEWLNQRGQAAFYDPEADNIRAYMDDTEIGGVEALAEVGARIIRTIHFIDAARATARWGAGHTLGVIQVITME